MAGRDRGAVDFPHESPRGRVRGTERLAVVDGPMDRTFPEGPQGYRWDGSGERGSKEDEPCFGGIGGVPACSCSETGSFVEYGGPRACRPQQTSVVGYSVRHARRKMPGAAREYKTGYGKIEARLFVHTALNRIKKASGHNFWRAKGG